MYSVIDGKQRIARFKNGFEENITLDINIILNRRGYDANMKLYPPQEYSRDI